MQNILRLFAVYGTHITFLALQVLCFYLIISYNQSQKSIFLNSTNLYAGKLEEKVGGWERYMNLDVINDSLATHNARLLEQIINLSPAQQTIIDSNDIRYELLPANIISNSYRLTNNHLTLDKGVKHGAQKSMGVISQHGLVGIIRNVSENLSHVVSLLHSQTKISATVKPYAYPGTLVWDGKDPSVMKLQSIPKQAEVAVGDTIVTSGYSTIFPEGIVIGWIKDVKVDKGSSNYNISVDLANELYNEKVVYIINNRLAEEQRELEGEVDE